VTTQLELATTSWASSQVWNPPSPVKSAVEKLG
jgi:hypothetical protein